jgi:cytochrome P450
MTELVADKSVRAASAAPPRVRELPVVGSAFPMLRDPLGFLERIAARHGDVVRFHLPGQRIYLFVHPSAVEQVLVAERGRLIKDKTTRDLSLLLGKGLLVSEGDFWRRQRRLAQPGFHRQRVAAYGEVMVRHAEHAIAAWQDGETRDLHQDMMRLTLAIVVRTLFGLEPAQIDGRAGEIAASLDVLLGRFAGAGTFVPIWLPTPGNRRARRAIASLDATVYRIIRERRQAGDGGDLLSMLMAATSDEDGAMDDTQLRDEAITLLLAGHETTALTLGYAFHLLSERPEVAERLSAEVDDVVGERPATFADVPRLRLADAIVRESMRLYPPAWAIGRETMVPCTIGGHEIPAGSQLWLSQWLVHRDPRWFADPAEFRPERWEGDLARSLPRGTYFPFGDGPRVCIGNAFAMMEAVLILVTIARRFRLTRADPRPLALVPSVTLRPRNGLPMRIATRRR